MDEAIAETGASHHQGHGQGDGPGHPARRRDGPTVAPPRHSFGRQAASRRRGAGSQTMARFKVSVGNDLARSSAATMTRCLTALRERPARAYLRGNELTLDGEDAAVDRARAVVDELSELVARASASAPRRWTRWPACWARTARAAGRAARRRLASPRPDGGPKTIGQKRYVDAIRANTVTFGIGPAGTGKTYLAIALAVAALQEREVARIILTRPAVEAGERLGLPARRPAGQGRSVPAAAVRRAARHARRRAAGLLHGQGHGRGGAARVHARAHAERLVHHPRRGPEHEPRADADVPDPARLRLAGRGHRRHHPDRPAARPALRAGACDEGAGRRCRTSRSSASRTPTSCATSWCSGSSTPTRSTPSATGQERPE